MNSGTDCPAGSTPVKGACSPVLSPTVPSSNRRCIESARQCAIPIFTHTEVRSLLQREPGVFDGWTVWQRPEGDIYFTQDSTGAVTSVDVWNEQAQHALISAKGVITQKLGLSETGAEHIEIYLKPTFASVEYYIVDHQSRIIFWLDNMGPESLVTHRQPGFHSPSYLRSALAQEYWTHVEYFPMHLRQELVQSAEDELMDLLRHGLIDDMTSPGSTCPHSARGYSGDLSILETLQSTNEADYGYRVASMARLWNAIARTRRINGFWNARLGRFQGLLDYRDGSSGVGPHDSNAPALDSVADPIHRLWDGDVIYQRHWASFAEELRSTWHRLGVLTGRMAVSDTLALMGIAQGAVGHAIVLAAWTSSVIQLAISTSSLLQFGRGQRSRSDIPGRRDFIYRYMDGLATPQASYWRGQARAYDLEVGHPVVQPGDILLEAISAAGLGSNPPFQGGSTPETGLPTTAQRQGLSFDTIAKGLTLVVTILGFIWLSYSTFHAQSSSASS